MTKYRERIAAKTDKSTASTSLTSCSVLTAQYWEDLISTYGLNDADTDPMTNHTVQTVLQEYNAYVMALLSAKGTDIIKFWEVCKFMAINSILWI